MPAPIAIPELGQLVRVRHHRFVELDVQRSNLPPDASSGEDDALAEDGRAFCQLERRAVIHNHADLLQPSGFDDPARLDASLDAVRWAAGSSADYRALEAPFSAQIAIEEYPLEPAVRALPMPRVNLPVPGDVVLGRTIETVVHAHGPMLRHRVRRILIARPSSIQILWRNQAREKFEQQATTLLRQIPNLRRIRDLLLPPLLSGHAEPDPSNGKDKVL